MLNGGPLNSAALNSAAHSAVPGPEPIIPGYAFTWRPIVRVGDDDVTPLLTGEIEVDREEGAAGVASFSIYLGDGPVVPTDWIGRTVTIDYATETAGEPESGPAVYGKGYAASLESCSARLGRQLHGPVAAACRGHGDCGRRRPGRRCLVRRCVRAGRWTLAVGLCPGAFDQRHRELGLLAIWCSPRHIMACCGACLRVRPRLYGVRNACSRSWPT